MSFPKKTHFGRKRVLWFWRENTFCRKDELFGLGGGRVFAVLAGNAFLQFWRANMFWRENIFLRLWRENTFWRKNAFLQFWQKNTFYDSSGKMRFAILEGKCVFAVLTEKFLGRHHIKQVEEEDDDRNDDGVDDEDGDGSEDRDVNVKDEEDNSDELGLCMWLLPYAFTEPAMTELKSNEFLSSNFSPTKLAIFTSQRTMIPLGGNRCRWSISSDAHLLQFPLRLRSLMVIAVARTIFEVVMMSHSSGVFCIQI
uniref:Uncharacterized protein n=1 Tax=Brassica oleracea var. oleracea TaxID=109376 RepID=A0A0D2ZTQ7_BRAOL